MAITWLTGFEHGVLSTAGTGLFDAVVGNAAMETTTVRTGARSLKLTPTAALAANVTHAVSGTMLVARLFFRFSTLPASADVVVCRFLSSGGSGQITVHADGRVLWTGVDVGQTIAAAGSVVTGTWYRLDARVDCSANPWVFEGKFEGGSTVTANKALAANTWTSFQMGPHSTSGPAATFFIDDVVLGDATGDFPFGDGYVLGYSPTAVGTHSLDAATSKFFFKDIGGVETALTTSETTSYQQIDDVALDADADHVFARASAAAAVAFDAASESHTGATGSISEASFTWSHNPVGTPGGVIVFVMNMVSNADIVTSVTYDGVTMDKVTGAEAGDTTTEPGHVTTYFLGVGVPATDPADIVVNRTNNTNELYAVAATVTCTGYTEVYTPGIVLLQNDGTLAEQSVTDGSPGANSVRFAAGFSGLTSMVGTGGASSTLDFEFDTGNQSAGFVHETTAGQGARNVGFSAGSDDRAFVHLAVRGTAQPVDTRYLEYGIADSGETTAPLAVRAIVALNQDSAANCAIVAKLAEGGSEATIYTGDVNSATKIYKAATFTTKPSGGAWTDATFDATTLRYGYTADADGTPHLEAAMLEAAFAVSASIYEKAGYGKEHG